MAFGLLTSTMELVEAKSAQTGQTELADLVQCSNPLGKNPQLSLDIAIVETGPSGMTRHMRATIDLQSMTGRRRMRVLIQGPQDVAGTSYFLDEDGQNRQLMLYLPALGEVRRFSSNDDQYLPGLGITVLTLFDLLSANRNTALTSGPRVEYLGKPHQKLYSTTTAGERMRLDTLWIDIEACRITRIEQQQAQIELEYSDAAGNRPKAVHWTRQDERRSTTLKISEYRDLVDPSVLTAGGFYRLP